MGPLAGTPGGPSGRWGKQTSQLPEELLLLRLPLGWPQTYPLGSLSVRALEQHK